MTLLGLFYDLLPLSLRTTDCCSSLALCLLLRLSYTTAPIPCSVLLGLCTVRTTRLICNRAEGRHHTRVRVREGRKHPTEIQRLVLEDEFAPDKRLLHSHASDHTYTLVAVLTRRNQHLTTARPSRDYPNQHPKESATGPFVPHIDSV